jgi:predicted alpha/beta superfamily hydrolase
MKILFLIFTICLAYIITVPTAVKLENTRIRHIKSSINGVRYKLFISLPKNYAKSDKTFPVVYLLDPGYSFAITHNIFRFLEARGELEEAVLVGIGYDNYDKNYLKNRTRDYTPVKADATEADDITFHEVSGGAGKFNEFIKTELKPYIKRHYKKINENDSTLIGHSFGGLFATWVYLTDNSLFDKYIAVSPSFWYHKEWIFTAFNTSQITQKPLYLAIGGQETERMREGFDKMVKILDGKNMSLKYENFPIDTHETIFPLALSHGISYIF